jgi:hypothetical protein
LRSIRSSSRRTAIEGESSVCTTNLSRFADEDEDKDEDAAARNGKRIWWSGGMYR